MLKDKMKKIKRIQGILSYYINFYSIMILFIISLTLIIGLTLLLVNYSNQFNDIPNALWWLIITAITKEPGYADVYPKTKLGYLIQFLIILLSFGILGTFIAKLTDLFIINNEKRGLGELDVYHSNHLLICGWSNKTKLIINQVLNEDNKYSHVVLVANIERNPFPDNNSIQFVKGKIDNKKTLDKAGVSEAQTAIILNEDKEDATTVLSSLIVRKLNPTINIIAEISNPENEIHFRNAGVNEVIINNNINSQLMVRSALYGGTSEVINELLSNEYGNEIYMFKVQKEDINKAYLEILNKYKKEKEVNIIGIKRGEKIITNPTSDFKTKKKDELIYIGTGLISEVSTYEKIKSKLLEQSV